MAFFWAPTRTRPAATDGLELDRDALALDARGAALDVGLPLTVLDFAHLGLPSVETLDLLAITHPDVLEAFMSAMESRGDARRSFEATEQDARFRAAYVGVGLALCLQLAALVGFIWGLRVGNNHLGLVALVGVFVPVMLGRVFGIPARPPRPACLHSMLAERRAHL
jgi:hypothetical protein